MKNILSLLIFLLPCLTFAQKKSIDGFMDIPFGSDSATVKAAVLAKGGKQVDSLCTKNELVFSNFSLSQRPVSYLFVDFVKNKAYKAMFSFKYSDNDILYAYDDLVSDITAVYGKPFEADNYPEFRSTAAKIRKVWSKDIVIKTIWIAKNKNGMGLEIEPFDESLTLTLLYEDTSLEKIVDNKRQSDL
ncbi:MAG: hypothetical protein JST50_01000 [Bacteroidetes bacterium]|jgi:hypothetical protein|nr:hypothetical protein [Bacteroidota bacterium]